MAELDEKTQKAVDRAGKQIKKATLTAVNGAIADAIDTNKDEENKDVKKAVAAVLRDLKASIKDATAD